MNLICHFLCRTLSIQTLHKRETVQKLKYNVAYCCGNMLEHMLPHIKGFHVSRVQFAGFATSYITCPRCLHTYDYFKMFYTTEPPSDEYHAWKEVTRASRTFQREMQYARYLHRLSLAINNKTILLNFPFAQLLCYRRLNTTNVIAVSDWNKISKEAADNNYILYSL